MPLQQLLHLQSADPRQGEQRHIFQQTAGGGASNGDPGLNDLSLSSTPSPTAPPMRATLIVRVSMVGEAALGRSGGDAAAPEGISAERSAAARSPAARSPAVEIRLASSQRRPRLITTRVVPISTAASTPSVANLPCPLQCRDSPQSPPRSGRPSTGSRPTRARARATPRSAHQGLAEAQHHAKGRLVGGTLPDHGAAGQRLAKNRVANTTLIQYPRRPLSDRIHRLWKEPQRAEWADQQAQ